MRKKRIKCVALVNVSCGDSILVESILRENYQQKGFHAAKIQRRHAERRSWNTASMSASALISTVPGLVITTPITTICRCELFCSDSGWTKE